MTTPISFRQTTPEVRSADGHPSSVPAYSFAAIVRQAVKGRTFRDRAVVIGCALVWLASNIGAMAQAPPLPVSSAPSTGDPLVAYMSEASQRFGIPSAWIESVLNVESGGNAQAVSPKGAMGLMQIMPSTWAYLRGRYALGADPFDIHDNILAGAAYLRELHDRYGEPGFLAAYNAGPARYENHLATGRPLPAETRAYVATLGGRISEGVVSARPWTEAPLFTTPPRLAPQQAGLFIPTVNRRRPQ